MMTGKGIAKVMQSVTTFATPLAIENLEVISIMYETISLYNQLTL